MRFAIVLMLGMLPLQLVSQDDDFSKLTGIKLPSNFRALARATNMNGKERLNKIQGQIIQFGALADIEGAEVSPPPPASYCKATDSAYDARVLNFVSPVRDQGKKCASCWAFTTAALLESSELVQHRAGGALSTQQLIACSGVGNCQGGSEFPFNWIAQNGLAPDSKVPYAPPPKAGFVCSKEPSGVRIKGFGFVTEDGSLPPPGKARIELLKEALCEHGTLAVLMTVTNKMLTVGSGIFSNQQPEIDPVLEVNHAVQLVGWDDSTSSWLVKNSWGTSVGQNGFFRVAYGSQWFGFGATWAVSLEEPFTWSASDTVKLKPEYHRMEKKAARPANR